MGDLTVGRIEQLTHTPGPWQVSPLDGRTCGPSRALVSSGTTIRQMQAVAIVTLRTNETDANARLISTAPDGLALARLVVEYFGEDDIDPRYDANKLRDMALALIAKAEGR